MAGMPDVINAPLDQLLTVETDNGVLFKIGLGVVLFFTLSWTTTGNAGKCD